ncbi:permease [Rhodobacterales bacterium]|nr:permease [Rhodobacterales bacterium]
MALILFTVFLWATTILLGAIAWQKNDGTFTSGLRDAAREAVFITPRLCVGILGAGFVAELLPGELVSTYLGAGSGLPGLLAASIVGVLIPGGPVVAFAVAAAALEAGAGMGPVIAFVVGWLLMSFNRTLVWELPIMGANFIFFRAVLALPVPILTGWAVSLLSSHI